MENLQQVEEYLKETGFEFEKPEEEEGVWNIYFEGENAKDIVITIIYTEDLVVFCSYIEEITNLNLSKEFLTQLLKFNNDFDRGKFAIADDWIIFRIDTPFNILKTEDLKETIELIAGAVDETYPVIEEHTKE